MTTPAPMIVARRYELHDLVGKGGCGMVFRATDRKHGRPVAVKMLTGAARQDPQFVERLIREQQALQALAGTHAVGAIDLCRADSGALCLVMEWLDGMDLEQRFAALEQQGVQMDIRELLAVMRPVLDTLQKAHELGIVHRDIKPANIFLLSGERGVRLLDFGLSRLKSSATLTAVDTVMGSPSYIAPEAWQGGSRLIGKQADLYSAAVIVYRALTGRVPFQASSLLETMTLVTRAARPSVTAHRSDLSPVVDQWVERALAIDPEHRFQHASSFQQALVAVLSGLPIPRHTLPEATKPGAPSTPSPVVSASERKNAITTALERAGTLLKRLAGSLSRVPRISTEPVVPSEPSKQPALAAQPVRAVQPQRRPRVTLPPVPRRRPAPVRPAARSLVQTPRASAVADTVPAIFGEGLGASSSKQESKTAVAEQAEPALEGDALITGLLAPSVAPGPAEPDAVGTLDAAASGASETGKPESTPEATAPVVPEPASSQSSVPAPALAVRSQADARRRPKAETQKKQQPKQRAKAAAKVSRAGAKQVTRRAKKSGKLEQKPKSQSDRQKRQQVSQPAPAKKQSGKAGARKKTAKKVASRSAVAEARSKPVRQQKSGAKPRKRQAKKA